MPEHGKKTMLPCLLGWPSAGPILIWRLATEGWLARDVLCLFCAA